jgi:hypothetical protein
MRELAAQRLPATRARSAHPAIAWGNIPVHAIPTADVPDPIRVKSETAVHENTWYQVVVTKTDRRIAVYVNGLLQGESQFAGTWHLPIDKPLYLGATPKGRATLRGLLDEVAFYNRALTPKEIQALYDQRERGPCKL